MKTQPDSKMQGSVALSTAPLPHPLRPTASALLRRARGGAVRLREAGDSLWTVVRPALPWAIILLGVGLRCSQYAFDRSLFQDEAFLATSVANCSFSELLKPLEFDQRAPAGFLLAVKIAYLSLGQTDLALRLVPLLGGILSLLLFYLLAKRYLPANGVLFGLLLFALSPINVFVSSDLKQYSTDVTATLAILVACAGMERGALRVGRITFVGLVGALAVWFSFVAVFVLAAVGVCYLAAKALQRRWRDIAMFGLVATMWAAGAATLYLAQVRHFDPEPRWKQFFWGAGFMPLPVNSYGDLRWLVNMCLRVVSEPVGVTFMALSLLASAYGIRRLGRQKPFFLGMLIGPIVAVFLASGFQVYPCLGRPVLFFAPLVTLLVAGGIGGLRSAKNPELRWLGMGIALLLLYQPAAQAFEHVFRGRAMYQNTGYWGHWRSQDTKPVMAYVRDRWEEGDLVYLHGISYVAFEYYAPKYGFRQGDYLRGFPSGIFLKPQWSDTRKALEEDLAGRPRVWVLFVNTPTVRGADERQLWLHFLDQFGERLDELVMPPESNVSVHLYDFTVKEEE